MIITSWFRKPFPHRFSSTVAYAVICILTASSCTTFNDSFVDRSAPTVTARSRSDFAGLWLNAYNIQDQGWIWVYKLDEDGTGSMVLMKLGNSRRVIGEYTVTWSQTNNGEVALETKVARAGFWDMPSNLSSTARLANDGLEVSCKGYFQQFYRPENPELSKMVANMRQRMQGAGDDAMGQIFGQVVSAALSSGVNTLVNNPRASMSEVRYQAAKGALEGASNAIDN